MSLEPQYVTLVSGESPCRILDGLADGFMRWLGKERVRPYLLLGPSADSQEFGIFQPVYEWMRQSTWDWTPGQSELLVVSTRAIEKVADWINDQGFHCAMATVDVRDTPCNETMGLTPTATIQVPFKSELAYNNLNAEVFSCPSGLVPESLPALKPWADRSIPVSCLLGLSNITRPAIADAIRSLPGARVEMGTRLDRQEYLNVLMDSQLSVACYGAGFNSYRYWEIPYCGAGLVAQRTPLLIPRDFQRGTQALFYNSPQEAITVIQEALAHPQETAAMALAGTHHVLTHHLTIHRAQYLTSIMRATVQRHLADQVLRHFPF